MSAITRRELVRTGGLLSFVPALLRGVPAAAAPEAKSARVPAPALPGLRPGPEIYESIGVRPLVNARGTYTIITGSMALPEVSAAMEAASRHYVHLDELAEAVGKRLAELTQAEWGIVTNGCAAALTHATVACLTGGNPDLHVRLPDLRGFAKDECVIPKHSRNVYDAAVRATGVKVIEVATADELEAALGPRTALCYILAGPKADSGPVSTGAVCAAAKRRGVPVLVDAAAEVLTVPNVHLKLGADLVAYSGGKCLRGPQSAGLLLGRQDLVRAAWVASAPHHGFGRGFKVGKEEALGMLMAVEMWFRRDHEAEWKQWQSWIDHIARRAETVAGVTTSVKQPEGLSNRMPTLEIRWDKAALGVSGDEVARELYEGTPRVALFAARGKPGAPENGLSIGPYMMAPGDERVVAEAVLQALKRGPRTAAKPMAPPAGDLSGAWEVKVDFAASSSTHALYLRQRGNEIDGMHQGDFLTREARGTIDGDAVRIRSANPETEGGVALDFSFNGTLAGDAFAGELDMGEYLKARFAAKRHVSRRA
jgi:uncharacterized pyridoxal phosphate-dependent enzyme